ncbi:MAG: cation diffusion facilitator family transporter [Planctomycetota bacterium]
MPDTAPPSLKRYAWLSIACALLTIVLKTGAYHITGSVGLLSDALESGVNLIAAICALFALTVAELPPDDDHTYGHSKAEYFSSGIEGALIIVAALTIIATSIPRLLHPMPLEAVGLGLLISTLASVFNLIVAQILLRAAKQRNSIALEADGKHLMTDVWTSIGVIVGIGLVAWTGWERLDPIVALLVAVNIVWSGAILMKRSALGLMDTALPAADIERIKTRLATYNAEGIQFHALRSRVSGSRSFISLHVLVPGAWTVHHGHETLERIEADIKNTIPHAVVFTHLESLDDPVSWEDQQLDRP